MRGNQIIILTLVLMFALIASIMLGSGLVSNQAPTLIIFGSIISILICMFLGQRIWLMFIFLISIEVPVIRGLSTVEIGYGVLVVFTVLLFLMRKFQAYYQLTEMDFWRVVIALVILQVYVRNPVGLNLFGASSVGGKPYFIAAASLAAGVVISRYQVRAKDLILTKWIAIAASFIAFPVNSWRYGLRGGAPDVSSVGTIEGMDGGGAGRDGSAGVMAKNLSSIVVSKISPLKACFHPVWAWLVLLSLTFAALSGYRNHVAYVGMIFLIGIAYHGKFVAMIISFVIGALALGALALFNLTYPLPANVQRALSPFPGTWEERHVKQAENSTEWRIVMWKEALFTDEWIQNKFLGDGLGMSRSDLEKMQTLQTVGGTGNSTLNTHQENAMLQGNYHSGPVQTIRTVGYFGLALILVALIRLAIHTHRQIKRCWGTPWQSAMLFLGIPIIAYPFMFTFIFGTFQEAVSYFFVYSGLIDLFQKNLPLPAYRKHIKTIARPMAFGSARIQRQAKASNISR